jgi:four helix bundle protein
MLLAIKLRTMKTHKDLDVWKQSIELVAHLYETTCSYPSHELYGITSQIRRASVSIPTNIAEGSARIHRKELLHL